MTIGLPVSRIVNVTFNFAAQAAQASNTSSLLIMGTSNVPGATYNTLAAVAGAYGTTAPEYLAASLFFSYNPQPAQVQIAQWYNVASSGYLPGGVLTTAQQAIANFNSITNGGLNITVNGTALTLTALNFASASNLNGVASVLTTALATATCTWNGSNFVITSNTTGAGVAASGTYTFAGQPANNDTVTINGQVITFVTTVTIPTTQVLIGTNTAATIQNLLTLLNNSVITNLTALRYSATTTVLTVSYPTVGTAGNTITIAKSSTNITVSGATLAGGVAASSISYGTSPSASYQDISTLFALTSATASPPVPGYAVESAVNAVVRMDTSSQYFYALTFATTAIADSDHQAIAAYIEGTNHIYGVSTQETTALSSTVSTDIGSLLMAAGYEHTFVCYSSFTPYLAAGVMAIPLTVDYGQVGEANTVMFKVLSGVTAETLTSQQANTLTAKRYNYFVNYNDGTAILQNGTMAGPAYIDEIVGITSIIFNIQNNEYNLLLSQPKVDQTDDGMALLTAVDEATLAQYVAANFIAPGNWTGSSFGSLAYNTLLPKGYYVYRAPISSQSTAARAARQAVPATIAIKLAGAVQSSSVLLNVNR